MYKQAAWRDYLENYLKAAIPLWLVLTVLAFSISTTVFALNVGVSKRAYKAVYGEMVSVDETMVIESQGIALAEESLGAQGTAGSPVEMTSAFPEANNSITAGNWVYRVKIKEASGSSVSGGTYKVEFFLNQTLMGTVYIKQAGSTSNIEGVQCSFDIGGELPNPYAVMVRVSPQ